jgi:tight adherence protein B
VSSLSHLLALKLAGAALVTVALTLALGLTLESRDSFLRRFLARHLADIDRRMRVQFIETKAIHVVAAQGIGIACVVVASYVLTAPALLILAVALAVAPRMVLESMHKTRVKRIEAKLDGFTLALANGLRATASPGRALAMVLDGTPAPLSQEIELVLREMRVGSTLEQALGNFSARVRSFQVDAALSGLLIGLQTGGNVPHILDGAAETLREMARLQGVLRSKTAEARSQANALTGFPLVMVVAFEWARPGYFHPLTETGTGMMIALIALAMWLASIFMMRKMMEVEL